MFVSPGRSGFQPELSLSFDSGGGNGLFGLGWQAGIGAITRKTDRGIPRYRDAEDTDVYVLAGAEDLVPAFRLRNGSYEPDTDSVTRDGHAYAITRYRPRVEAAFARIERWQDLASGDVHWRTTSSSNVTTVLGLTAAARIADPQDDRRVFSWMVEQAGDDKGNVIRYDYKQENTDRIDRTRPEERHRLAEGAGFANRYPKRIRYGNLTPLEGPCDRLHDDTWLFEVVFDYGEHHPTRPTVDEEDDRPWLSRADAFSSYRAGFEVRTQRLCRRILMFHRFEALGPDPVLVRSTELEYEETPALTYLTSVVQAGFRRKPDGSYARRPLPKVSFTYARSRIDPRVHEVDADSLDNLPEGLDGSTYRWIDLHGDGVAGILTEQADAWFYKQNEGQGRLGALQLVAHRPRGAASQGASTQLIDLEGDGQLHSVDFGSDVPGFHARTDESWSPFVPFTLNPNIDWNSPNLKLVDLTGDGRADLLITDDDVFTWYRSRGREGFDASERVWHSEGEEAGPRLVFADATNSIYLADLCGDGLSDLVRIRNGEVCYWPNLGYGRFGPKVTMDRPPVFDAPDRFDPRRIRLADIDGSGTTDLIYLGSRDIRLWFNQAGNSWSAPHALTEYPPTTDVTSVDVLDFKATGTACIVWSSALPGESSRPMHYIDLMAGGKPHLLETITNNLGSETRITYASSTSFYLADRQAGSPWATKLPFPVHVVTRVETLDRVSLATVATSYRYRHGYFDRDEREFRGFGFVEQRDGESFDDFRRQHAAAGTPALPADALFLPPIVTRTWFHTGAWTTGPSLARQYAAEYYRGDPLAADLPDARLPDGLTALEAREACRAVKGKMLRQETYTEDESPLSRHPYSVVSHSYQVRRLQPSIGSASGVFFTHQRETLEYHYERNPDDPRVAHSVTLEVDDFGNTTKSAALGYARRAGAAAVVPGLPGVHEEQRRLLATVTEHRVANQADHAAWYRIGVPIESRTYELPGIRRPEDPHPRSFDAIADAADALQKRLIEHTRTLYLADDLSGPLPLGHVAAMALTYETYALVFTQQRVSALFGDRVDDGILERDARFVKSIRRRNAGLFPPTDPGDDWWVGSGRTIYETVAAPANRNPFFLPLGVEDPLGSRTLVTYDRPNNLLPVSTTDPVGNIVSAKYDYRVLQPNEVTDVNRCRTQVLFDTLGVAVATAVMGPAGEPDEGDTLAGVEADLAGDIVAALVAPPFARAAAALGPATTRIVYDVSRVPNVVCTIARETHGTDLLNGAESRLQLTYSYYDGLGRTVQQHASAAPGEGRSDERWLTSGWGILDNRGNAVRKYEPFFSDTPAYRPGDVRGVSSTTFYDAAGRAVAALHPDHTFTKVVFDPWQQATWDATDTVLLDPAADPDVSRYFRPLQESEYAPSWYARRATLPAGDPAFDAARQAAAHAGTPARAFLDTLGRTFLSLVSNGAAAHDHYATRLVLDIEGNELEVIDARLKTAMSREFDMLGGIAHSSSSDAGDRWTLANAGGSVIYTWDGPAAESKTTIVQTSYDPAHRPLEVWLWRGAGAKRLAERALYGEGHPEARSRRLRGKVYQQYDEAGVVTNQRYDFKGNVSSTVRRLARDYVESTDWQPLAGIADVATIEAAAEPLLEGERFTLAMQHDALNRPVKVTSPDGSVSQPEYDQTRHLLRVHLWRSGSAQAAPPDASVRGLLDTGTADMQPVEELHYDARGQRQQIAYGNGATTRYSYDPETFRLAGVHTTRVGAPPVQALSYSYDPCGNITAIDDATQAEVHFQNTAVSASSRYEYDALYRLVMANGREHLGQIAAPETTWDDSPRTGQPHPNDGAVMQRYTELYAYDGAGNIASITHKRGDPPGGATLWTRTFDATGDSNHLLSTTVGAHTETYQYDRGTQRRGNMTSLWPFTSLTWNFKDQLRSVDLGGGGTAFYTYDASGQRVRKVVVRNGGTLLQERIYVAGWEVYRERPAVGTPTFERQTLHVMDNARRIAIVETKTLPTKTAPRIRYQLDNHLGSAVLELDGSGAVIGYEEYYPYGSTSYAAVPAGIEASARRYRYNGKERDEETGFAYYGARHYASWLCRWLTCDPVVSEPGENPFEFVHGNPISRFDPDGRSDTGVNELGDWEDRTAGIDRFQNRARVLTRSGQSAQYSKMFGSEYGNKNSLKVLGYLDQPSEQRVVKAIHTAADRAGLDPNFVAAAAFHEGLGKWMERPDSRKKGATISAYGYLGADRFAKEHKTLIARGFLRKDFGSKDFKVSKTEYDYGETGEIHPSVTFTSVESGLEAMAAMLAYRRSLLSEDLQANGVDPKSLTSDELDYWTSVYFLAGAGGPADPHGSGRAFIKKRAAGGRDAFAIPAEELPQWRKTSKGKTIRSPLPGAQHRVATKRYLAAAGFDLAK